MKNNNAELTIKYPGNTPLLIAGLVTFAIVFLLETLILKGTGGVFMYPLDDPFIHMQVAKNLAFYNTWGINQHEFGSASSSILYTLLLAGIFKLFSANVLVPFIINCVAAIFLLAVVHKWLGKQQVNSLGRTIILLLLVFLTPLPVIIVSGMEHTLQCLFSFLFLTAFSDWLAAMKGNKEGQKWKLPIPVILYGVLVVMIRYEGLFLVGVACLLLLYYRKVGLAFLLGFLVFIPVIVFGICSLAQGSYFLPNSVLVKSEQINFSLHGIVEFIKNTLINKLIIVKAPVNAPVGSPPPGISLLTTQRLLIILPLTYLLFLDYIKQKRSYFYILSLLSLCIVFHLSFAATGWFYRYEAYLILIAVVIVAVIINKSGRLLFLEKLKYARILTIILLFALFFPLLLRAAAAFSNTKQACVNIYQQQYQMAEFLKEHYNGATIAANDIGAISYHANIKIIDLWGLGSIDIARSKKGKYWTPVFLDSLVRKEQVTLAIVYDDWFDKDLLSKWTKVATWQIQNNVICGGDTVSFYVTNSTGSSGLKKKLQEYQPSLPAGIKVVYTDK